MDFLRRYKSSTTMTLDEPGYEPEDNSPDPERILLEQSRRDQVRQRISHLRGEIAIPFLELELAQRIRHGSRCDCRGDFDCFDPDAAKRQGNRRSSRRNSRQPPAVSRRSIGWMRRARISTPSSRSFRARLIFHRRFRISPRKTSSSSEGPPSDPSPARRCDRLPSPAACDRLVRLAFRRRGFENGTPRARRLSPAPLAAKQHEPLGRVRCRRNRARTFADLIRGR